MGMMIDEYMAIKEQQACISKTIDILWEKAQQYKQLKADYEARLKADMVDMLTEILTDFDNQIEPNSTRIDCESIIEQKISGLEGKDNDGTN